MVEADQILSGIGLISNPGARFEAPETISAQGRFEDVHRGKQHLKDMELDGGAGEVLYPSQGLFYLKVADTLLMSTVFRAYNDWRAEFCRTDPARLKGIAMINLDDVRDSRTTIRGSPAATPPESTILTWRGWPSLLEDIIPSCAASRSRSAARASAASS
ncbi:MAG: hypothetical protein WCB44_33545 [Stellaceae bacterium]